jgi:ribosomal protein S18 acetylase RimI-like enzyme
MKLVESSYQISLTDSKKDFEQIVLLNQLNHKDKIDKELWASEGFLFLEFDINQLDLIRGPFKHVVAKSEDELAGYALVLTKENGKVFPFYDKVFEIINTTKLEGKLLKDINYFIMAQICVAKSYRGQGVFKALYRTLADQMSSSFEKVIIEVSPKNIKSMNAHQNIGFEIFDYYEQDFVDWNVMVWDMK